MEVAVRAPVLGLHAPAAAVVAGADIEFTSGDVAPVHEDMVEAAGGRNVWIVGAETSSASSPTPGSSTR